MILRSFDCILHYIYLILQHTWMLQGGWQCLVTNAKYPFGPNSSRHLATLLLDNGICQVVTICGNGYNRLPSYILSLFIIVNTSIVFWIPSYHQLLALRVIVLR